jgi:ribosomal protein S18 acetylase RimI-like enzyme
VSARESIPVPPGRVLPAGVSVSFGTPADIERLEPLWLGLHKIHQEAGPELAPYVDDETSWRRRRRLYEHCLAQPDSFLLLVERGALLIGYVLVIVEPDGDVLWSDTWLVGEKVAELETMYLVPEERGRGLGGVLLDIVDAELERRGIADLVIGAVPGNLAALKLYERRGFKATWVIVSRFAARREPEGSGSPAA